MKIVWPQIMETEREQFEAMSEKERFRYFLLLQYGSPYEWGKENPEGSDCSGAVELALYAATGFFVRTTADGLYRKIFTNKDPGKSDITAAFFVTNIDRDHGGTRVEAGTVIHVAGFVDEEVILNSQEPKARIRTITEIARFFQNDGCTLRVRGLDRVALAAEARTGVCVFDPDVELSRYFEKEDEA
jgi:murein DD-endopeptidase